MPYTTAIANAELDARLGSGAPATIYLEFSSTTPNADGTGVTEPAGGSYARLAVTNNVANWPAAVNRIKSNGAILSWPQATANWAGLTHILAYDVAVGGTPISYGPITGAPVTVNSGTFAQFAIGALTFQHLV
jgi:hypothetical protein